MLNRKVFGIPAKYLLIAGVVLLAITLLLVLTVGVGLFNMLANESYEQPIYCEAHGGCSVLQPIIYILLFVVILLTGFAYTTLLERKGSPSSNSAPAEPCRSRWLFAASC